MTAESTSFRTGRSIGWAVFLAMSWTWCIGMFFPVILLRDLGVWAFVAFAIPNILGATALGWIQNDRNRRGEFVRQNESACVYFSLTVILFHAFFAAWMIRRVGGPSTVWALSTAFALFWMLMHNPRRGPFVSAMIALVVSLAVLAIGFHRGLFPSVAMPIPRAPTTLPVIGVLWLAPALAFGFLLCPWLDLTFHAAKDAISPAEGRAAFTIGFVLIFPLMLMATYFYSGWLVGRFERDLHVQLGTILAAHFIVQSAFTIAAHTRQLAMRYQRIHIQTFTAFSVCIVIAVVLGIANQPSSILRGYISGEEIYIGFMGFFALIFPAYVWLCAIPPRRSFLRFATVVIIALPLFAFAFFALKLFWLVPGVAIVLLAKWNFTPRRILSPEPGAAR